MCKYCEKDTVLIKENVVADTMLGWNKELLAIELFDDRYRYNLAVVLDDRGYLRLVDEDDFACLDHGEKIKIKFCPMCGKEFE